MVISCVFSLDMLQTGNFEIVKYNKEDKDEVIRLIKNQNSITNTMCVGDASKIVSSFLGIDIPQPMRKCGNVLFPEFQEMLFVTLSGMNLKTQSFDKYEDWMGIKFFYIKRK